MPIALAWVLKSSAHLWVNSPDESLSGEFLLPNLKEKQIHIHNYAGFKTKLCCEFKIKKKSWILMRIEFFHTSSTKKICEPARAQKVKCNSAKQETLYLKKSNAPLKTLTT